MMNCPYPCKPEPEVSIDAKGSSNFIMAGREASLTAIQNFFRHNRRHFFVLCGDRGQGKTRLVEKALGSRDKPLKCETDHIEELPRRVVGVWADLSLLGIHYLFSAREEMSREKNHEAGNDTGHGKGGAAGEGPKLVDAAPGGRRGTDPVQFNDLSLLRNLSQAIVDRLGPHRDFRKHGKGLRTILGGLSYHSPLPPDRIPNWLCKAYEFLSSPRSWFSRKDAFAPDRAKGKPCPLFYLYGICVYFLLVFALYLGISLVAEQLQKYALDTEASWRPLQALAALSSTKLFFPLVMVSVLLGFCHDKWAHFRSHEKQLRAMSYAFNYRRREEGSNHLGLNSDKGNLAKIPWLAASKQMKRQELAEYAGDIPNMLRQLKIYLFHLHRRGISPVLIIDELDKLGSNATFLAGINQTQHHWDFVDWFNRTQAWRENTKLLVFIDTLARFKESIGGDLPIVLIGDMAMARLLEHSEPHYGDGPYHTLAKERILLGPIDWKSWLSAMKRGTGSKPPNCTRPSGVNACRTGRYCPIELQEVCSAKKEGGCLHDCLGYCRWAILTWIEGEGRYAQMFSRQQSYAHQQWPLASVKKNMAWCEKAVCDLDGAEDLHREYLGWLPGDICRKTLDADVQAGAMAILHRLLLKQYVYLPRVFLDNLSPDYLKVWRFYSQLMVLLEDSECVSRSILDDDTLIREKPALGIYRAATWFRYKRTEPVSP